MALIGTKGARLDILVRQGATFGPYPVTMEDGAGEAINLTGSLPRAQIRKSAGAALGAEAVCVITDAPAGRFTFEFTAEDTALLTASDVDEQDDASLYQWDLEMEDASGRVIPVFYGDCRVFRQITEEAL